MKRRADYILEKICISREKLASNNRPLIVKTSAKSEDKSAEAYIIDNDINKENVPSLSYEITNSTNISNPMSQHFSESPSIIRNSPDKYLPNTSPNRTILYEPTEVQMTNEIECFLEIEPEVEKQQSETSSDSSSSSNSCSSGSSRSSSSSSSSDIVNRTNPGIDRPTTSKITNENARTAKKYYHVSPINSNESDVDLSDSDPTYTTHRSRSRLRKSKSSHSSSSSSTHEDRSVSETKKISKKRQRNPSQWKQNVAKVLRNTGKAYVSCTTKKTVPARSVKGPCKCKLKCPENVNDTDRNTLFQKYWSIGNIELQRAYIRSCMMEIKPRYKYTNADRPRLPNNAFFFTLKDIKIRVCKTFFLNTLDICDRQIRTVKQKTDPQGFITKDIRGKHSSRKPSDPLLIESIKQHINSIPRIESHYLRASTSREYISGDKTITDLWKDFNKMQKDQGSPTCDYWLYYDIFNKDFNIGFFQPKKDRCDLCFDFELATPNRKLDIKNKYEDHLREKDLCRQEKRLDRQNINEINICAVYDLQAVMQCPTGDTSSFYYKSKLNCLNFTIVQMLKKTATAKKRNKNDDDIENEGMGAYGNVYCYFWDEVQGKRGANEIGSCVLDYLRRVNEENQNKKINVTFYSDNCCGQNKNKYITSLYSYAVNHFENICTITHKYLIKGHTQNEGDIVHSLIEKEIKKNKKSGPIYTPYQYVTLIKNARKNGKPFTVFELTHDFFFNLKKLQEDWGYNYSEDEHKNNLLWANVKVLKFDEKEPFAFFYKTSYSQNEFIMVNVRNKRKKMAKPEDITLTKAYLQRLELSENKKRDLRDLVTKNLIPTYYAHFFNSLF